MGGRHYIANRIIPMGVRYQKNIYMYILQVGGGVFPVAKKLLQFCLFGENQFHSIPFSYSFPRSIYIVLAQQRRYYIYIYYYPKRVRVYIYIYI